MEPCFHAIVWAGTRVASGFNAMHVIMQAVSWNIGQLSGPLSCHIGQLSGPVCPSPQPEPSPMQYSKMGVYVGEHPPVVQNASTLPNHNSIWGLLLTEQINT